MKTLRVWAVADKTGLAKQTIYDKKFRDPTFPKPFKLGSATVWDEEEIDNWLQAKKGASHGSDRSGGEVHQAAG